MDSQSNVQKMILVDQNSGDCMRSTPSPALNRASALDEDMQRVIDKPNFSDYERRAAYDVTDGRGTVVGRNHGE